MCCSCWNTAGWTLVLEFGSVVLGWEPRNCIFNKFPSDADVAGLGTTLWEPLPSLSSLELWNTHHACQVSKVEDWINLIVKWELTAAVHLSHKDLSLFHCNTLHHIAREKEDRFLARENLTQTSSKLYRVSNLDFPGLLPILPAPFTLWLLKNIYGTTLMHSASWQLPCSWTQWPSPFTENSYQCMAVKGYLPWVIRYGREKLPDCFYIEAIAFMFLKFHKS